MKALDDIDSKIVLALEKDARVSLKQLAKSLGIKTSTIYHRLHRLQETNVLKGFTVILNPEFLGIEKHSMLVISVKNLLVDNIDAMFISSFARYLGENFPECLLVFVGDDNHVYVLAAHQSIAAFDAFLEKLRSIPYVGAVEVVTLRQFVKGSRLHEYSSLLGGTSIQPAPGGEASGAGEDDDVIVETTGPAR